ncbi:hypothetical protein [Candidatus Palauibacter sp.]|uniref:hypothetical protein n=1 Tax=Candidatus Palauibacter sp. TaxID=3101350 RepID=UPI003B020AEA
MAPGTPEVKTGTPEEAAVRPILEDRPAWIINIVGAVVGYLVTLVPLLLGGALASIFSFSSSLRLEGVGWWLGISILLLGLALHFAGGFVSSRLAGSRAAAWILIALLVVPGLVQLGVSISFFGNASTPGGLGWAGIVALPALLFGGTAMILLYAGMVALPVLIGARYEEQRRWASR